MKVRAEALLRRPAHDFLTLGIAPSVAATTRIAPSIWAAPVIMFFT